MNQKPSPLHRASEWIVDHYRLFFVVFAALLVFSAVASGWVKVENDVAAYLPADSETRQGLDIMEQEFQTYGSAKILLRDTDADAAAATAEQIRAVDGVDSCTYTMNDTGSALLSGSLATNEIVPKTKFVPLLMSAAARNVMSRMGTSAYVEDVNVSTVTRMIATMTSRPRTSPLI